MVLRAIMMIMRVLRSLSSFRASSRAGTDSFASGPIRPKVFATDATNGLGLATLERVKGADQPAAEEQEKPGKAGEPKDPQGGSGQVRRTP